MLWIRMKLYTLWCNRAVNWVHMAAMMQQEMPSEMKEVIPYSLVQQECNEYACLQTPSVLESLC